MPAEERNKDNLLRAIQNGPFRGVDTTTNLANMDNSFLRIAEDADIEQSGAISKRDGFIEILNVPWGARTIRKGLEFNFGNPLTTQSLVFGHEAAGSTGVLGQIVGGVVVAILTNLDNAKPSLFTFSNLCFLYNGIDDFLYDGTVTRQIGIDPPVLAPTNNGPVAGNLQTNAIYSYAYTYYNSVTGAESSPSPVLAGVTGNTGYIIGVTPGDPTTADTIRLYRSVDGGTVLFLDNTGAIGAVTINSTQADAGLGKEIEIDNTRPSVYGLFPYATVLNSRVGVTGDADIPNRVRFSAIYSEGPHPESFPATHFSDCESSRGKTDINVGIGKANEVWVVLKKNTVGRIEQIGANDVSSSQDPVLFDYKEISGNVGAVSHNAQVNVYGQLLWLGRDNIYATDGVRITPVGGRISKSIAALGFTEANDFSGFNDEKNKRIIFTIKKESGDGEPNFAIVGQYRDWPEIKWTFYNIRWGDIWDVPSASDEGEIYAGNVDFNGLVYQINTGDNDNAAGIPFRIRTAPFHFNLQEEDKLYTKDIIFAQGTGDDYDLVVKSLFGLDQTVGNEQDICLKIPGLIWDQDNWDEEVWGGVFQASFNYYVHNRADYHQLEITNVNPDEPITIYGFAILARLASLVKGSECD